MREAPKHEAWNSTAQIYVHRHQKWLTAGMYIILLQCSLSIPNQIILLWPFIPIPLCNICANCIFILHHFMLKYCYGILKKLVGFSKINCFYVGKWILKSGPILSPSVTVKVFCIQVNNQTSPYCYTRLRTSLAIRLFFFDDGNWDGGWRFWAKECMYKTERSVGPGKKGVRCRWYIFISWFETVSTDSFIDIPRIGNLYFRQLIFSYLFFNVYFISI